MHTVVDGNVFQPPKPRLNSNFTCNLSGRFLSNEGLGRPIREKILVAKHQERLAKRAQRSKLSLMKDIRIVATMERKIAARQLREASYSVLVVSAVISQTWWRGLSARWKVDRIRQRKALRKISKVVWKRILVARKLKAAMRLQAFIRTRRALKNINILRRGMITLQAHARQRIGTRRALKTRVILRAAENWTAHMMKYSVLHTLRISRIPEEAALKLQRNFRKHRLRKSQRRRMQMRGLGGRTKKRGHRRVATFVVPHQRRNGDGNTDNNSSGITTLEVQPTQRMKSTTDIRHESQLDPTSKNSPQKYHNPTKPLQASQKRSFPAENRGRILIGQGQPMAPHACASESETKH